MYFAFWGGCWRQSYYSNYAPLPHNPSPARTPSTIAKKGCNPHRSHLALAVSRPPSRAAATAGRPAPSRDAQTHTWKDTFRRDLDLAIAHAAAASLTSPSRGPTGGLTSPALNVEGSSLLQSCPHPRHCRSCRGVLGPHRSPRALRRQLLATVPAVDIAHAVASAYPFWSSASSPSLWRTL